MEPNPNGGRPPPMTEVDCDLAGLPWMPLHGPKLLSSDFNATASDAEFRAAINLWLAAYLQKPAASLPNNDRVLANLAGFGRDLKGWAKVRDMALYGFVKCSDGRLYHPFLAAEAKKAWTHRLRERDRKADYRQRLAKQVSENTAKGMAMSRGTGAGRDGDVQGDSDNTGTATTQEQKKEEREGATPLSSGDDVPGLTPDLLPSASVTRLEVADGIEAAVIAWNTMAAANGLSQVAKLTDPRRRHLSARLRDCGGLDGWRDAVALVAGNEFLLGRTGRGGWKANFDFMLQQSSFTKLMEGAFTQAKPAKPKDPMRALDEHLGFAKPDRTDDDFPFPTIDAKASWQ